MAARKTTYTASDIQVLEGLEPVRKRPAMYIGGTDATGYHHLLWEILDNSVDEVINGYATRIEVTLHQDGKTVTVTDDGRGIPVDVMTKYKKPAIEVILTTLHSGGKFEQGNYIHSGGLHGVGSSVVNALSRKLVATIRRDGAEWRQTYQRGTPVTKLENLGPFRGHRRVDHAGRHGIDVDPVRRHLQRQAAREGQQPALRRAIGGTAGAGNPLVHRGDVDDLPAPALALARLHEVPAAV